MIYFILEIILCSKKWKKFNKGRLEYEGEYYEDIEWTGKGYDENGNILYELKNGNGKVKDYDDNGNLIFEGEFLNGQANGNGKEFYPDGNLEFEG